MTKKKREFRKCLCGCGKKFAVNRWWQKFIDSVHQKAYHSRIQAEAMQAYKAKLKQG